MPREPHFTPALFQFLRDLAANNDRSWFHAHKARYEAEVKGPLLAFISDFGPHLEKISPHFVADPRPVGGSMFRINRDTRFSKDKRPYKENAGAQFRHEAGKDVHAPGFYLHLQPESVFFAAGVYHPDGPTLRAVREAMVEQQARYRKVTAPGSLGKELSLGGDSLARPPAGFDREHPLIEEIKRKDCYLFAELNEAETLEAGFLARFAGLCRKARPYMSFLCDAGGLPF